MSFKWKSAFFGAFAFIAALAQASDAINPDVTQANIQQTICVPGYTKTVDMHNMHGIPARET